MKDELTRRGFLKAAGLAAAGATLLSRSGWAQQEEKKPEEPIEKDKEDEKPEEDTKEEENYDDLFEENESDEEETRACPQCGALMYRQGRTWTCENCGYSYVE
jgi:ribosomal protein S27AE